MTPACESAESGDFHEDEVVDCDVGVESSEVSRTFATTTTGEPAVSALSSDPMTVLGGALSGPRRALVLGGGGVLGFAWIVGALSALQVEAGFDARDVQLVVGTSAGAVAAAALGCAVSVDQMRRHHQGIPAPDDPPIAFEYDTTGRGLPPRPGFGFGSPRLLLGGVRHPRQSRTLLTLTGALPTGRGSLQPVADMVAGIAEEAGIAGRWPIQPRPWIVAVDYWSGRQWCSAAIRSARGARPMFRSLTPLSRPARFRPGIRRCALAATPTSTAVRRRTRRPIFSSIRLWTRFTCLLRWRPSSSIDPDLRWRESNGRFAGR